MPLALLLIALLWIAVVWLLYRNGEKRPRLRSAAIDLAATGGLLALVLVFFWRTLSGDVFQPADGGDLVSFLFPTYRFAARTLAEGALPLWNPHLYGGMSFINDIQAGFLYLPNLILFRLWPDFPYVVMQWLSALHLWWAGVGTYFLIRSLRPGGEAVYPLAAFFGGVVFAFCDPLLLHFGNLNLIAVLAWLPWVMLAFHRALERRSLRWAAVAAVLFAVGSYAGHAQSSLIMGLGLVVYAVAWALIPPSPGAEARATDASASTTPGAEARTTEALASASSGAEARATDASASTTPGAEARTTEALASASSSAEVRATDARTHGHTDAPTLFARLLWSLALLATTGILALMLLAPILLPSLAGVSASVRTDFTYQESVAYSLAPAQMVGLLSPGFFGRGPALHWSLWDRVELPYLGVPALMMAIAALWTAPAHRRRALYSWLALSLFGLLVALGIYGILHGVLSYIVPFFDQLRAPARMLILFALGGAVLAAVGLDVVMKAGVPARSGFMGFLKWGAILLAGVFVPLLLVALVITQSTDELFLRASLALLAMVLAAASWVITWLLVAARNHGRLSLQLFGGLMVALLFLELAAAGAYTDISSDDPTAKYSHPEIEAFLRADPEVFRIDTLTDIADLWQPDTAALLGFEDVGGIANPLMSATWKAYWESTGGRDTPAYNALNVKYLIARDGTPLPENWELALDAEGVLSVWQNRAFVPRAWLSRDCSSERSIVSSWDPALPGVVVERISSQSTRFTVSSPLAGVCLVISSPFMFDSRITVNGRHFGMYDSLYPPSFQFTVVPIDSGEQVVTLEYRGLSWFELTLFCMGVLAALVLFVFGGRRNTNKADSFTDTSSSTRKPEPD